MLIKRAILVLIIMKVALIDDLFNLTSEYGEFGEYVGGNDQDLDHLLKSTPLKSQLMQFLVVPLV